MPAGAVSLIARRHAMLARQSQRTLMQINIGATSSARIPRGRFNCRYRGARKRRTHYPRRMDELESLKRLRWQCRRGLLELDVVLERVLARHGGQLRGEHLSSLMTLLTYADNELWDLICARTECSDARLAGVVQWMRDCRSHTGLLNEMRKS